MAMTATIEQLIWHDAQLVSVSPTVCGDASTTITVVLNAYPDDDARIRETFYVECLRVERCAIVLDFVELQDNRSAGNIANGYVKRFGKKKLLRVSLMDGYIDVICAAIELKRS